VDPHCLGPNQHVRLAKEWRSLPLDSHGDYELRMIPPAVAIAALMFHPKMAGSMHREAKEQRSAAGEREYAHPFTCDHLLRAQEELRQRLEESGLAEDDVIDILVGLAMGKDKTDVERSSSLDPLYIKLLNTSLEQWHKRHSKVMAALFPILRPNDDDTAMDQARSRQRLYQRSMALWFVLLEVCARKGIRVTHKYAARTPSWPAYARHMLGSMQPAPARGVSSLSAYAWFIYMLGICKQERPLGGFFAECICLVYLYA